MHRYLRVCLFGMAVFLVNVISIIQSVIVKEEQTFILQWCQGTLLGKHNLWTIKYVDCIIIVFLILSQFNVWIDATCQAKSSVSFFINLKNIGNS